MEECEFVDMECPKHCGKKFKKKDLKKHLEEACPNRTIPCDYCTKDVLWNSMESHVQKFHDYRLKCGCCGKENIARSQMQEHINEDCRGAELGFPFSTELESSSLESVQSSEMEMEPTNQIRRTEGGAEAFPQEQDSHDLFVNDLAALCHQQRAEMDEVRRLVNALTISGQHMEHPLEDTRMSVERPLQQLTVGVNRLETKVLEYEGRVCNGYYIWRIENYRQCRQDAVNGVMKAIYSPAIHTNLFGYKLCMRINLNGVDSGVGKFITLFVHMMQGDYDNILEWPFTGRIALSILDQREGVEFRQHISETLVAKSNLLAFQRPTAPRNYKGYGYVEFAPIEQIREPQYVKNNTMLVRIQIFQ